MRLSLPAFAFTLLVAASASAQTTAAEPADAEPAAATEAVEAAAAPIDEATYAVRLADLELRIQELKDRIRTADRRKKVREALLRDVASGPLSPTHALVRFENELSALFRVRRVKFAIDGVLVLERDEGTESIGDAGAIEVFRGTLPPGDHTLDLQIELQGHGYGLFSYLDSYDFTLRSQYSFSMVEGQAYDLDVIGFESGDLLTPIDKRPATVLRSSLMPQSP